MIDIGANVSQLYILQSGQLKVEKKIELKDANLWPTGVHKWEISICKRKVLKELAPIVQGQAFGIHEIILK